jgi:acyl carrier protein
LPTLHEQLQDLMRDVFGDDMLVLTPEMTAKDVPGWDSLGQVNLMFAIEDHFGVQLTGNGLSEFPNVGALETFLQERAGS